MRLLGLELNSTRVRAVAGAVGEFPCAVPLDPPHLVLPMMVRRDGRDSHVGIAALRVCRSLPHQICINFLPHLEDQSSQAKTPPENQTTLALVLRYLQRVCSGSGMVTLCLPAYLTASQARVLLELAKKSRLLGVSSVTAPLAHALAAYAEQPWLGAALVVDCDEFAFSLSRVHTAGGQAQLLGTRCLPHLGLAVWKERLLNALADTCIVQSRRDPRDTPAAEQMLYEQLDSVFEASAQGRMLHVAVQTSSWYQNLVLHPPDAPGFCSMFLRQALAEIEHVFTSSSTDDAPRVVVFTSAAGQLPGLVSGVRAWLADWHQNTKPPALKPISDDAEDFGAGLLEDFGEDLLSETHDEPPAILVLGVEGPAQAAHTLAAHFQRGDLRPGHLDRVAPLPLPQPVEAGPAHLHYQGQDYQLDGRKFSVGRHSGCDLVFDGDTYPMVATRHCEIHCDQWNYLLHNRSKQGTLLNDRPVTQASTLQPGDWIRLGPDGPLLRFLGQRAVQRPLHTTA